MKIYAKQVPPEYQESPLFNCDWPENVYVFGNRHYNQHDDRLQKIRRALEDLTSAWGDLISGDHSCYESWIDALNDLLLPDGRGDYTRAERKKIAALAHAYSWCNSRDENKILCDVLELVTGYAWEAATIRGCCQGDWQNIIYPAEYGRAWLEAFETEYFNTGTEWIIDPDGDAYSIYCTGWNNDLIRAEIADAHGCDPGDIVLLEFTGWCRTAEYTEVSA